MNRYGRKEERSCLQNFADLVTQKVIMTENEISKIVVEEAIYIHKSIGPGMLESAYVHCLAYRLIKRNLAVKTQVPVPLIFEEVKLEC